jgi:hypothetical protein
MWRIVHTYATCRDSHSVEIDAKSDTTKRYSMTNAAWRWLNAR